MNCMFVELRTGILATWLLSFVDSNVDVLIYYCRRRRSKYNQFHPVCFYSKALPLYCAVGLNI